MSDPYVYPGSDVLRNLLDIYDAAVLEKVERRYVAYRLQLGAPAGRFGLPHLQAIHRHLFQDVYDWAGKLRTVELAKGDSQFLTVSRIEMGIADVQRQLAAADFHRGLDADAFAAAAARTIGDLNYVHPFREGNGRTQLEYLRQLGEHAGHDLDLSRLPRKGWITASKAAHVGDYEPMRSVISRTMGEHRRFDNS